MLRGLLKLLSVTQGVLLGLHLGEPRGEGATRKQGDGVGRGGMGEDEVEREEDEEEEDREGNPDAEVEAAQ